MLDIKIKPSYQSLDIGNITINMVSESPLFYAEIAQRSLSYNFTIVATPRNIRLLKIPNIIESNDQFEDFKADLIINKLKETEVDLYIKEVNKDYIKLSLVAVDFDVDFLEENLQQFDFDDEIDLGNDSSEVRTEIKSRNTQSYPDTNFVFPMIYNDQFYEDENSEYLGVINNYDVVGETVVANTDSPVKNKTAIVPYFFLVYILKRIFELNNISLKGSFIEHTEVQKILIHNNFALDQFNLSGKFIRARFTATTGYYMPYTPSAIDRTLIFNDESTFPNEDDDNIYDNTTGEFTIDQTGVAEITLFNFGFVIYSVRYDVLSPLLTIEVHIDGVKRSSWHSWEDINNIAMFKPGVKITFSELKLPSINLTASDIGKKGVIKFGLNYLDLSDPTGIHSTRIASVWAGSIVEISIQSWSDFNILQPITSPNLHMPNMQIKDFVNAYLKWFKIIPNFDLKTNELFFDLKFPIINLTQPKIGKKGFIKFGLNY
ncbi:MAG: hypothetical protein J5I47_05060 [Vicingus serpentipes]|nr:hypothetical protein [Vicingus serpentipes]